MMERGQFYFCFFNIFANGMKFSLFNYVVFLILLEVMDSQPIIGRTVEFHSTSSWLDRRWQFQGWYLIRIKWNYMWPKKENEKWKEIEHSYDNSTCYCSCCCFCCCWHVLAFCAFHLIEKHMHTLVVETNAKNARHF